MGGCEWNGEPLGITLQGEQRDLTKGHSKTGSKPQWENRDGVQSQTWHLHTHQNPTEPPRPGKSACDTANPPRPPKTALMGTQPICLQPRGHPSDLITQHLLFSQQQAPSPWPRWIQPPHFGTLAASTNSPGQIPALFGYHKMLLFHPGCDVPMATQGPGCASWVSMATRKAPSHSAQTASVSPLSPRGDPPLSSH